MLLPGRILHLLLLVVMTFVIHRSETTFANDFLKTHQSDSLTVTQFINSVLRHVVSPPVLLQFEDAGRAIVRELNSDYNSTILNDYFTYATVPKDAETTSSALLEENHRDVGQEFQVWLERTFDLAYMWAKQKSDSDPRYLRAAHVYSAAHDWIRGVGKFRFTSGHVQVFTEFLRSYLARPDRSTAPAAVYAAFKQFMSQKKEKEQTSIVRVRREILSEVPTIITTNVTTNVTELVTTPASTVSSGGWSSVFWDALSYVDTAVILFNDISFIATPAQVALRFVFPPLAWLWTGASTAGCFFEVTYELQVATHSNDRWYDWILCATELLDIIPIAGTAVKLAVQAAIAVVKIYCGVMEPPALLMGFWHGLTSDDSQIVVNNTLKAIVSAPAISGEIVTGQIL